MLRDTEGWVTDDLLDDAIRRFDEAAEHANITTETHERLSRPRLSLKVSIPVRMDDGSLRTFAGYRVRYDDTRGPAKGGIRFHPAVNASEITTLAFWMTFKTALMGLPFGGGKGGIAVDPKQLSMLELERLSRGYIDEVVDVIGPDVDIPAPDVATNELTMGWMAHEYAKITRGHQSAAITGKPLALGGIPGRSSATSDGAFFVIQQLHQRFFPDQAHPTVAVQGFGNAGSQLASLLFANGWKVVAVNDSSAMLYDPDGLDIDAICRDKARVKELRDVDHGPKLDRDDLLSLEVDALVPAALEGAINEDNAADVRAKVIFEVANGPVTSAADAMLDEAGIEIVPDILVNAGGVTVSWFEWVANRQGDQWEKDKVRQRLETRILAETRYVADLAAERKIPLRTAAYVHALERLSASMAATGDTDTFVKD